MLIATGTLTGRPLAGQVTVVTGAGRGIGYEATRSLIWLDARGVVAEQLRIVCGWREDAASAACMALGSSD